MAFCQVQPVVKPFPWPWYFDAAAAAPVYAALLLLLPLLLLMALWLAAAAVKHPVASRCALIPCPPTALPSGCTLRRIYKARHSKAAGSLAATNSPPPRPSFIQPVSGLSKCFYCSLTFKIPLDPKALSERKGLGPLQLGGHSYLEHQRSKRHQRWEPHQGVDGAVHQRLCRPRIPLLQGTSHGRSNAFLSPSRTHRQARPCPRRPNRAKDIRWAKWRFQTAPRLSLDVPCILQVVGDEGWQVLGGREGAWIAAGVEAAALYLGG